MNTVQLCPCGQRQQQQRLQYEVCCQPYHLGNLPQTPEQLMRSRYSAFVLKLHDYLIATHHKTYLNGLTAAILDKDNHTQWLALNVNNSSINGDTGSVEFHAWYNENGLDAIHEISQFVHEDGRWYYTTGEQLPPCYPKRNDACFCHSGKKFKQCCLNLN
ncbi:YchJ family metal-binding protein [Shewanella sp. Isolate11]|uniref:YchJ family protein n=1 Tax=Shewanella sp. Isolate11 TaxID=2908530 RepID=UPI001EFCE881|nr:YchJ family metal-binding protein [Shewanella sp. Isolate11]MCG9696593.1 SEC-C domain-containing protein [Shewanella sp. Isolate11]